MHLPKSFILAGSLLAVVVASPVHAATIAPIQSHPGGQSYSEWAAEWWQWALEAPVSVNPLIDETGANCAYGQAGHTWFLSGSWVGPVLRACTIPAGRALFFPMVNQFYGAFLTDPPETRTEEYMRPFVSCVADSTISATIDGVPVADPYEYYEESEFFEVVLPEDNLFGLDESVIPELTLDPTVDAGYYLYVHPLPKGAHRIVIGSANACDQQSYSVSYAIQVE